MQTDSGQAAVVEERVRPVASARYSVQFPTPHEHLLAQNEAYFYLEVNGDKRQIRFHDYDEIYRRPGLYEQLFYDRLKCESPRRMAEWLANSVAEEGGRTQSLRVLDLGAGNGMMAESLCEYGVSRVVGIDIIEEAREAAFRDRPGLYDDYYVADLVHPVPKLIGDLSEWRFDCLTTVAALGFGDIPTAAFVNAYNLIEEGGWICFNIRDTFLSEQDYTGFSVLIRAVLLSQRMELHRMVRYRHRYSIDGQPLYYYGVVGRKRRDLEIIIDE